MERKNADIKKIKKPQPVVRQTLTSMYRTVIANPLLVTMPERYKSIDISVDEIKLPKEMSYLANKHVSSTSISSDVEKTIPIPKTSHLPNLQDRNYDRAFNNGYQRNQAGLPNNRYGSGFNHMGPNNPMARETADPYGRPSAGFHNPNPWMNPTQNPRYRQPSRFNSNHFPVHHTNSNAQYGKYSLNNGLPSGPVPNRNHPGNQRQNHASSSYRPRYTQTNTASNSTQNHTAEKPMNKYTSNQLPNSTASKPWQNNASSSRFQNNDPARQNNVPARQNNVSARQNNVPARQNNVPARQNNPLVKPAVNNAPNRMQNISNRFVNKPSTVTSSMVVNKQTAHTTNENLNKPNQPTSSTHATNKPGQLKVAVASSSVSKSPLINVAPSSSAVKMLLQTEENGDSPNSATGETSMYTEDVTLACVSEEDEDENKQIRKVWNSPHTPVICIQRRSASAERFDAKRLGIDVSSNELETHSMLDIKEDPLQLASEETDVVPEQFIFKTPTAYRRRSVAAVLTPATGSMFPKYASTPAKDVALDKWLEDRGEPVTTYQHLKTFDDENKENYEGEVDLSKNPSYEDLKITQTEEPTMPIQNIEVDAKAALEDLLKLIVEGYSLEKCDSWLNKIREKQRNIHEGPLFWECKAAIERERGNFSSAIECYKTAIVKGAEVEAVDQSLEHLLQTFNLLDINTDDSPADEKKNRKQTVLDARQIFKSSIIQFAVTERNQKEMQKTENPTQYLARPVRRSTRLSRSAFVSTPGVKLCSSLNEVDESVRKNMSFKGNKLLL